MVGALTVDLEVCVGAVGEELGAAGTEVGQPGDELLRRHCGRLVGRSRGHAPSLQGNQEDRASWPTPAPAGTLIVGPGSKIRGSSARREVDPVEGWRGRCPL